MLLSFLSPNHVLGDPAPKAAKPFAEICSKLLLLVVVFCHFQQVFKGSADRLAFSSRAMIWQSFQALQIFFTLQQKSQSCCILSVVSGKKEHLWYDRNLGKSSLWEKVRF